MQQKTHKTFGPQKPCKLGHSETAALVANFSVPDLVVPSHVSSLALPKNELQSELLKGGCMRDDIGVFQN